MGFFDLKAQCAICDKIVGLNRFQLTKNVWICPSCKKTILKNYKHIYNFADLQKMSVARLKDLAGITPKKYSDEEIKEILDFCTENQKEFIKKFKEE